MDDTQNHDQGAGSDEPTVSDLIDAKRARTGGAVPAGDDEVGQARTARRDRRGVA